MELLKGKLYKIVFQVGNQALGFTCEILNTDFDFVTFKDKFGKKLTYNKSNIISCEEIE